MAAFAGPLTLRPTARPAVHALRVAVPRMSFYTRLNATQCFRGVNGSDRAVLEADRQQDAELAFVYRRYHAQLQVPFAAAGLLLALWYGAACRRAIRARSVSRKSYLLMLNRCCGDVLTCLVSFVLFGYTHAVQNPNRDYVNVLDSILMGCFWAGMTSYVALSCLKMYAVARPLQYRREVTLRRCVLIVVFSWLVFLLVLAYAVIVSALSKVPALQRWSGCTIETCVHSFYRIRNVSFIVIYVMTLSVFLATVVLIKRHEAFTRRHSQKVHANVASKNSIRRQLMNRFPLWKLALNVGTFALFNLCYVLWAVYVVFVTSGCYFMEHFNRHMRLLGLVHLSIVARIVVDPILAFVTDTSLRRAMFTLLGQRKPKQSTVRTDSTKVVEIAPEPTVQKLGSQSNNNVSLAL